MTDVKREQPIAQIKQVIERPLVRTNGIKAGSLKDVVSKKDPQKAVKAIDTSTAFKTLSGLKRAVVKAHQACQMAEMDIEDMYNDPTAVASAQGDTPSTVLDAIRDASKLVQKASDLVETAKQAMSTSVQPEATQQVPPAPVQLMKKR